MRTKILVNLLTLLSWLPTASANQIEMIDMDTVAISLADGRQVFFEFYKENSNWIMDTYEIHPRQLQEKIATEVFASETMARKTWLEKKNLEQVSTTEIVKSTSYLVTTEASEVLWTAENEWSSEWETQFYDWVDAEFDEKFFERYNIATDCADAATALRWIFARAHKLPAGNSLAGSGVLFTHESMKESWLRLPTDKEWHKDQRFLKALDYLTSNTYTKSISGDSFPVEITRKNLRPGVFHLTPDRSHTRILAETHYDNEQTPPIILYWSNVPKIVRPLYREIFVNFSTPISSKDGFRLMRWPELVNGKWRLKSPENHPHYSLEQIEMKDNFSQQVFNKLEVKFNPRNLVMASLNELVEQIDYRISVVNEGWEFCKINDCSPGTENWENWSTPSRDKRIIEKDKGLLKIANELTQFDPELLPIIQQVKSEKKWTLEGKSFSLHDVLKSFELGLTSSDPRVSIERRWAVSPSAAGLNLADSVKENLLSRSQKIGNQNQTKSCKDFCEYGSKEYNELHTHLEDKNLVKNLYTLKFYCSEYKPDSCQEFQSPLEETQISAGSATKSAREWLDYSPWLVSDPNSIYEHRWGSQKSNFKHSYFIRKADAIQIHRNGLAKIENAVLDMRTGEIFKPPLSTYVQINKSSSKFPFYFFEAKDTGPTLGVFDSSTREWKSYQGAIPGATSAVTLWGAEHLITVDESSKKFHLLKLTESGLEPVIELNSG